MVEEVVVPQRIVKTDAQPARKPHELRQESASSAELSLANPVAEIGPYSKPLPAPVLEGPAFAHHEASAPGVVTPPQRASSYAGLWKANVGSSSCRIQLSSTPSLDLYKASAQGCSNAALKMVNGWSFRDDQVILFSRGQVVARLSGAEAALAGTLNGSETGLAMTR
jgi:Protease inhibitor Inh